MNEFTRAESDLVDNIVAQVKYCANKGVQNYAEVMDWDAASQAVIEMVKEKLGSIK